MKRLGNILLFLVLTFAYVTTSLMVFFTLHVVNILIRDGKTKQRMITKIKVYWFYMTKPYLGFYFCEPIILSYDIAFLESKKLIIISNHLTLYDWWFFGVFMDHFKNINNMIFTPKKEILSIPIFGNSFKFFGHIFLNRKLERDITHLEQRLDEINKMNEFELVIFPEGTVIENETRERSIAYAKKNNIKVNGQDFSHDRVLLPKTSGFKIALKRLDEADGLVDFTIGSSPYERQPYDSTPFTDIFIKRSKVLSFFMILDFHKISDNVLKEDFLFKTFQRKDQILKKVESNDNLNSRIIYDIHKSLYEKKDPRKIKVTSIEMWKNKYYLFYFCFYSLFFVILHSIIKSN